MAGPPTVQDVKNHYEAFPFPSGGTPHLVQHWTSLLEAFFGETDQVEGPKRFLDAGCGTGDNALNFASCLPQFQFHGLDLSEKSIALANEKLKKRKLQNLEFIRKDLTDFSAESPYDYISCLGVLHHHPAPAVALQALVRNLKPGGLLFADVYGYYGYLHMAKAQSLINLLQPDFGNLEDRVRIMEWTAPSLFGINTTKDRSDPKFIGLADGMLVPVAYSYKIREAKNMLETNGLDEVRWLDSPHLAEGTITYKTFRGESLQIAVPDFIEKKLRDLDQANLHDFFELFFSPFDYLLVGQRQ